MKTIITAGLSKVQSEEVTREFNQSAVLRERLIDVLNGKKESLRSEVRSKTSYDSPSWAFFQADSNGYERAISEMISLLSSKND
jgi:hypothetical protein